MVPLSKRSNPTSKYQTHNSQPLKINAESTDCSCLKTIYEENSSIVKKKKNTSIQIYNKNLQYKYTIKTTSHMKQINIGSLQVLVSRPEAKKQD